MTNRIAINGFGRIGRGVLRVILERELDLEVVAINDLTDGATLVHLFNFDSVYGRAPQRASIETVSDTEYLTVGDRRIQMFAQQDPAKLPWSELDVDVVLEATGRFTDADKARIHVEAGAGKVLVSAPSSGADVTIVRGINWHDYDAAEHRIVSMGSCTTNALAPLAKVLHDTASIRQGFMSTVHAYTQDQNLVDAPHRDLRRARAATLNLVPTTTGAAKAIGKVLPELDGKLIGDAIRVPVPVGSLVELNVIVERETTAEELLAAYRAAAEGELSGVLKYSNDPLVSSDIVGDDHSSIFDAALVRVAGQHVKVSAWYDNEMGFSYRAAETLELLSR